MRYGFLCTALMAALLASCQSTRVRNPVSAETLNITMTSQRQIALGHWARINPDCKTIPAEVRVVAAPRHGRVDIVPSHELPVPSPQNVGPACATLSLPQTKAIYEVQPGYRGPDKVELLIIFAEGSEWSRTYEITVR